MRFHFEKVARFLLSIGKGKNLAVGVFFYAPIVPRILDTKHSEHPNFRFQDLSKMPFRAFRSNLKERAFPYAIQVLRQAPISNCPGNLTLPRGGVHHPKALIAPRLHRVSTVRLHRAGFAILRLVRLDSMLQRQLQRVQLRRKVSCAADIN